MATTRLGDETTGEDPTVRELEERLSDMFGYEAGVLTISATMANLVAVMTHCSPGDELFCDSRVHLLRAEAAGATAVAGVMPTTVESDRGHVTVEGIRQAMHPANLLSPRPRLVWLENTHNRAGGTVLPVHKGQEVVAAARQMGLAIHMDGARLLNAAIALDATPREAAVGVDSLTIDFTKGWSCPLGSMLLGSSEFVARARRARRVLGGGMRQAGIIAACALVALDETVDNIREDHATAHLLATRIGERAPALVDTSDVETNIVNLEVDAAGGSSVFAAALAESGVLVTERPPNSIRLVTHRHITRAMAETAAERIVATQRVLS